jgi:hypothetical protein
MAFNKIKFLDYCREECKLHGVKLVIHPGRFIKCDGFPVAGWFQDGGITPELHIAKARKDWYTVLSHELSHMHQWVAQCPSWKKYKELNICLDTWLNQSKEFEAKEIDKVVITTIRMERDCEKRSLALLERFGYTKREEYIKKGNAYLLFYLFVADTRLWSKQGKSPYSLPEVWPNFPSSWNINTRKTYKSLKHLYDYCL